MRFFFVSLILFLVFSMPVKAQESPSLISAAYLLSICKKDEEGKEIAEGAHTACQAYIAGIVDYHKLLRSLGTPPSAQLCVPNTVKLNDLQDIVWVYLESNSQHDAFNAAPAVVLALNTAFPCKK
ncbi:MAG: Rap1a/Tai family immunity protein [Pseudomonadota bacterium]